MKEILIFAGTTEGRRLSECLADSEISHTVCVATEYGELMLKEHPLMKVHRGRMDQFEIRAFIQNGNYAAVVDATHPYAEVVTGNIKAAMNDMNIPYLRLIRDTDISTDNDNVVFFETNEECERALEDTPGNILLTTGSKELSKYCVSENVKNRLFVRVLPGLESLSICTDQGITGKHIIAMQGPFTIEMNEAVIHQYAISCMVTKQSGTSGGYYEKIEAARKAGISVYVIGHRKETSGYNFNEICKELENICGKEIQINNNMVITLAGIGMGSRAGLTKEVYECIKNADILLGAARMLEPYTPRIEKRPFYLSDQIIPYLNELKNRYTDEVLKVVVLFSGDSGFYSGCQTLYKALIKEVDDKRLQADIRVMPGISSIAYLAAEIGESYQDADILSMHGKELYNLANRISEHSKTFMIMSGVKDVNKLGLSLIDAGMSGCEIVTGYQLSYDEQQIVKRTPYECTKLTEEGLYTCFIRNPETKLLRLTHGISDDEFIRDKIPMTKEEIREISICKLKLHKGAVVYDIGSGTGSVAVEVASLSPDISVYAIEQKNEAVSLINKNMDKFHLDNIKVIEAKAPSGLEDLPTATHAFIGGSGGNMNEILDMLYASNPSMRVVINAISLETISEIKEILSFYKVENEEIVQIQVNRSKKAGNYHLMQAENPIWICAFNFCK